MRIWIQIQITGHTGIVKHMLHLRILGCGHRQKVAAILLQGYVRELYLGTTLRGNYPQYTALCVLDSWYAIQSDAECSEVRNVPLSPILIESLCNLTCSLLNTRATIIVSIIIIKCSPQPDLKHHHKSFIESYIISSWYQLLMTNAFSLIDFSTALLAIARGNKNDKYQVCLQ